MDLDSSVCRVCLLSATEGFSLQHKTDLNKEYTFLEMFNACTRLEAIELDDFPQFICQSCSKDLLIAFNFLYRAAASNQFLKNQQEVKKEVEHHYLSEEDNIKQEEEFDFEESSQTEHQYEKTLDQSDDDIPPQEFEPVQCELINDESKEGFNKQFGEEEFISENVSMESNENSIHASDAGRKISKDSKKSAVIKGQSVECKLCGKILKQMSIKYHLTICQKDKKLNLSSSCQRERRYKCSECGKGFFEKQALKVHMKRHMGDKEYHCTICPKQFTTKKCLDVHVYTHNNELGRFVCKHCEKRFPTKADLIVHERFHTGDYPFQCEFCDKSYAVKSHYNYHLAKHKGITYKCDQCDKEFKNRGSLTAHKFKHNDRMPHECSICEKGFASPYKLNRHMSCHKPKEEGDRIK